MYAPAHPHCMAVRAAGDPQQLTTAAAVTTAVETWAHCRLAGTVFVLSIKAGQVSLSKNEQESIPMLCSAGCHLARCSSKRCVLVLLQLQGSLQLNAHQPEQQQSTA